MNLYIRGSDGRPIYEQIIAQIKTLILTDGLKEGDALPSMRQLAKDLRISVITTKRAYEELEREGFIETIGGKGCYVKPKNLELFREQNMKLIDERLEEAIEKARLIGMDKKEFTEIIEILWGE